MPKKRKRGCPGIKTEIAPRWDRVCASLLNIRIRIPATKTLLHPVLDYFVLVSEEQRNAPYTRKSYSYVDYSCKNSARASA